MKNRILSVLIILCLLLSGCGQVTQDEDKDTMKVYFLNNTETGVEENLTPNSDVIPITLSVSPDGSKVAFDNDVDGNIYVVDLK